MDITLNFREFDSINDIEMTRDILCLVSSWEETPYFIVMQRKEHGIVNSFDGSVLDNTKILKWAYLPEV